MGNVLFLSVMILYIAYLFHHSYSTVTTDALIYNHETISSQSAMFPTAGHKACYPRNAQVGRMDNDSVLVEAQ